MLEINALIQRLFKNSDTFRIHRLESRILASGYRTERSELSEANLKLLECGGW
jgi:hypothetical protein